VFGLPTAFFSLAGDGLEQGPCASMIACSFHSWEGTQDEYSRPAASPNDQRGTVRRMGQPHGGLVAPCDVKIQHRFGSPRGRTASSDLSAQIASLRQSGRALEKVGHFGIGGASDSDDAIR